jgi:hypothetical protein
MQMVPPVMMTRTRDSGYCVAMVLARLGMSDIVTVPLTPFRAEPCLQMQTSTPLRTEDPDGCRCSGDSRFQGRVSLGDATACDGKAERRWCLRYAVGRERKRRRFCNFQGAGGAVQTIR